MDMQEYEVLKAEVKALFELLTDEEQKQIIAYIKGQRAASS